MPAIGNNCQTKNIIMQATLSRPATSLYCIRISDKALCIAHTDGALEPQIHFTAYVLKSGIDQASQVKAILENTEVVPTDCQEATILVDSEVMLVPNDEYEASAIAEMYDQTITGHTQDEKLAASVDVLSSMAVFPLKRETHQVLSQRFGTLHIHPTMWSLWCHFLSTDQHLHRNPLYGYFHDNHLDIFRFQHERFRFYNRFAVEQAPDALYFLLYVWRQLGMDAETDHMVLIGDQPAELAGRLERHLRHVSSLQPAEEFMNAPASHIAEMPYDLLVFLEGTLNTKH